MIEEMQEQETASEKETGRLEAFSDGVFAAAITITEGVALTHLLVVSNIDRLG